MSITCLSFSFSLRFEGWFLGFVTVYLVFMLMGSLLLCIVCLRYFIMSILAVFLSFPLNQAVSHHQLSKTYLQAQSIPLYMPFFVCFMLLSLYHHANCY